MFDKLLTACYKETIDAEERAPLVRAAITYCLVQGIGISEKSKDALDALIAVVERKSFTFCSETENELKYVRIFTLSDTIEQRTRICCS